MATILSNHEGGLYLESTGMASQQQPLLESKHHSLTILGDEEEKEKSGPSFSQIMEEKISSM